MGNSIEMPILSVTQVNRACRRLRFGHVTESEVAEFQKTLLFYSLGLSLRTYVCLINNVLFTETSMTSRSLCPFPKGEVDKMEANIRQLIAHYKCSDGNIYQDPNQIAILTVCICELSVCLETCPY